MPYFNPEDFTGPMSRGLDQLGGLGQDMRMRQMQQEDWKRDNVVSDPDRQLLAGLSPEDMQSIQSGAVDPVDLAIQHKLQRQAVGGQMGGQMSPMPMSTKPMLPPASDMSGPAGPPSASSLYASPYRRDPMGQEEVDRQFQTFKLWNGNLMQAEPNGARVRLPDPDVQQFGGYKDLPLMTPDAAQAYYTQRNGVSDANARAMLGIPQPQNAQPQSRGGRSMEVPRGATWKGVGAKLGMMGQENSYDTATMRTQAGAQQQAAKLQQDYQMHRENLAFKLKQLAAQRDMAIQRLRANKDDKMAIAQLMSTTSEYNTLLRTQLGYKAARLNGLMGPTMGQGFNADMDAEEQAISDGLDAIQPYLQQLQGSAGVTPTPSAPTAQAPAAQKPTAQGQRSKVDAAAALFGK